MSDLKKLELTERDFDLLIEGLDAIPEKGIAGEMFGDLLGAMLLRDDDSAKQKLTDERNKRAFNREKKVQEMKEDIKILQGKLLMLKRYLIQEDALKQTYDILNHVK